MGHKTANNVLGRKGFTEKFPELTVDYISALVDGSNFYWENPEEVTEVSAEALGISVEKAIVQI